MYSNIKSKSVRRLSVTRNKKFSEVVCSPVRCTCPSSHRRSWHRLHGSWRLTSPCPPKGSTSTRPSSFGLVHCNVNHLECLNLAFLKILPRPNLPWNFDVSVLSHLDGLHLQEFFVSSQHLSLWQVGQLRVLLEFLVGEGALALTHGRWTNSWFVLKSSWISFIWQLQCSTSKSLLSAQSTTLMRESSKSMVCVWVCLEVLAFHSISRGLSLLNLVDWWYPREICNEYVQ